MSLAETLVARTLDAQALILEQEETASLWVSNTPRECLLSRVLEGLHDAFLAVDPEEVNLVTAEAAINLAKDLDNLLSWGLPQTAQEERLLHAITQLQLVSRGEILEVRAPPHKDLH